MLSKRKCVEIVFQKQFSSWFIKTMYSSAEPRGLFHGGRILNEYVIENKQAR